MRSGYPVLTGTAGKVARWSARALAIVGALLSFFILMSVIGELRRLELPFVLAGDPFGSYEQPTQLGLATFAAANVLFLLGAILAFRWEAVAARILLVAGIVQLLLVIAHLWDFPRWNLAVGLALGVAPPLVIGGLLMLVCRKPRPALQSGGDQGTIPHSL